MRSIPVDRPGYIYFVRCPANGRIKVGFTKHHPDRRLATLRASSPVELEPIGVIPGEAGLETQLLMMFFEYRSHSEWFEPGPHLVDFIATQADPWPDPDLSVIPSRGEEKWARMCRAMKELTLTMLTAAEIQATRDRAAEFLSRKAR